MLEALELQALAKSIVRKSTPAIELEDVVTEDVTSSEGEDALRITLILSPSSADAISGEDALKLLVDIREALNRGGEDRLPIVEYATADDVPGEDD